MKNIVILLLLLTTIFFGLYFLADTGRLPAEVSAAITGVITNTSRLFKNTGWRGYASFADFAKAADVDEFLGRPLDETGFKALMAVAFLGSIFSDTIHFDIVSGPKLSERYGVAESLRKQYNYLVKRSGVKDTTTYLAYYTGDTWLVMYDTEK